ncbi:hypothetical protein ACSBR2_012312 [Camellia fascicularis]
MWFYLLKCPNFFPRIAFSLKMSGVRLGCSRAEDGSTMQSIDQSHTLCSSGGL